MTAYPFIKMHGLGNDYVYFDWRDDQPIAADALAPFARRISDRHRGVGGDGIILLLPTRRSGCDYCMRILNADGSEAEMCGNGVRALGKYVLDKGLVADETVRFDTLAGVVTVTGRVKEHGLHTTLTVDMGIPRQEPAALGLQSDSPWLNAPVGMDLPYQGTAVSMGNPHLVLFVDDLQNIPVAEHGSHLEHHPRFANRTNVEFARIVSPEEIELIVWERGSGITQACGTGACATAVAAVLTGRSGRRVTVHLPGGDLWIDWREEDGHVLMTGPAAVSFVGLYHDP